MIGRLPCISGVCGVGRFAGSAVDARCRNRSTRRAQLGNLANMVAKFGAMSDIITTRIYLFPISLIRLKGEPT